MTLQILPMSAQHLDQVWSIEQQAHTHPWAESIIRDLSSRGAAHHVLLEGDKLVGYFYAQNIVGEVTLLNIAVAPNEQGKGYGTMLLDGFLDVCEGAKAESAWLEVRESNHAAIHLYQNNGFNEVDRRINYYPAATDAGKKGSGKEDAIIMSFLFL